MGEVACVMLTDGEGIGDPITEELAPLHEGSRGLAPRRRRLLIDRFAHLPNLYVSDSITARG